MTNGTRNSICCCIWTIETAWTRNLSSCTGTIETSFAPLWNSGAVRTISTVDAWERNVGTVHWTVISSRTNIAFLDMSSPRAIAVCTRWTRLGDDDSFVTIVSDRTWVLRIISGSWKKRIKIIFNNKLCG